MNKYPQLHWVSGLLFIVCMLLPACSTNQQSALAASLQWNEQLDFQPTQLTAYESGVLVESRCGPFHTVQFFQEPDTHITPLREATTDCVPASVVDEADKKIIVVTSNGIAGFNAASGHSEWLHAVVGKVDALFVRAANLFVATSDGMRHELMQIDAVNGSALPSIPALDLPLPVTAFHELKNGNVELISMSESGTAGLVAIQEYDTSRNQLLDQSTAYANMTIPSDGLTPGPDGSILVGLQAKCSAGLVAEVATLTLSGKVEHRQALGTCIQLRSAQPTPWGELIRVQRDQKSELRAYQDGSLAWTQENSGQITVDHHGDFTELSPSSENTVTFAIYDPTGKLRADADIQADTALAIKLTAKAAYVVTCQAGAQKGQSTYWLGKIDSDLLSGPY